MAFPCHASTTRKAFFVAVAFLFMTIIACDSFATSSATHGLLTRRPNTTITVHNSNNNNNNQDTETTSTQEQQQQQENPSTAPPKIEMKTWNPLRLLVLKVGMTEPMYSSPLNREKRLGVYACACCGHELFDSNSKYDSGSGWPSFWRSQGETSIRYQREFDGRLEIQCQNCQSHLGHVFPDGPRKDDADAVDPSLVATMPASEPKTDLRLPRFCVNGASLKFQPRKDQ